MLIVQRPQIEEQVVSDVRSQFIVEPLEPEDWSFDPKDAFHQFMVGLESGRLFRDRNLPVPFTVILVLIGILLGQLSHTFHAVAAANKLSAPFDALQLSLQCTVFVG